MSYYEDVYLQRINHYGLTPQERILATKAYQFKNSYLKRSIYRVEFQYKFKPYVGALQPVKESEQIVAYQLLLPLDLKIKLGDIVEINNKKWLPFFKNSMGDIAGYNKYGVILLDRILTWWNNKQEFKVPANITGRQNKDIEDIFRKTSGAPSHREAWNLTHVIIPFSSQLKQDNYCAIDKSERRFIISGYDSETVPGVMYLTLDITMARDDKEQVITPDSFWGV